MENNDDLRLRNDVAGALIAGGHWHGDENEVICATITQLCKFANERNALRAQVAALVEAGKSALDIVWVENVTAKRESNTQYEATTKQAHDRLKAAIAAAEGGGK